MKYCAVVDTNVIVSALLSKKGDTATVQVFRTMLGGRFTPLIGISNIRQGMGDHYLCPAYTDLPSGKC